MAAGVVSKISLVRDAFAAGEGVVRLAPCWVPRSFLMPGGRLKLDPRDLYALGAHRGGIDERWFSSTTQAANGPGTPEDEGLSYIAIGGQRVLLREAVASMGEEILGADAMARYGGWNVLCKFFDNLGPIPHHMHQMEEHAKKVGQKGKPEAYYFPPQYNFKDNNFPYTFMGLEPGTTQDDVRLCLERWNRGDNGILYHSKAYRLQPGTGWQVDAGILHAPGDLLVKDVPPENHHDLDYIIGMLDWDANVDPEFAKHRLFHPRPVRAEAEMAAGGYAEKWVCYSTPHYSAKELTVFPGRSAVIHDAAAYGLIVVQGWGAVGKTEVETPSLIRYGAMTKDELFVSAAAAGRGVEVRNQSDEENLVMLKHFGPGNPDAAGLLA
jgi:hypothetical protein